MLVHDKGADGNFVGRGVDLVLISHQEATGWDRRRLVRGRGGSGGDRIGQGAGFGGIDAGGGGLLFTSQASEERKPEERMKTERLHAGSIISPDLITIRIAQHAAA